MPTHRLLFQTWLILMGLTALSLFSGRAGVQDPGSLGIAWVVVLLAVTFFKTRLVLMVFLNLKSSTPGWRGFFMAFLLGILLLLLAGYAAARQIN
ncbi:MAG: cytochrome C oxidase subunit IV family protein [Alphaproteobacteria bacterium]|nr:cytochrome C oxidase subunit IV family protein [Alphaproteobacteria bacterium]